MTTKSMRRRLNPARKAAVLDRPRYDSAFNCYAVRLGPCSSERADASGPCGQTTLSSWMRP